jgi:hypothetical protein
LKEVNLIQGGRWINLGWFFSLRHISLNEENGCERRWFCQVGHVLGYIFEIWSLLCVVKLTWSMSCYYVFTAYYWLCFYRLFFCLHWCKFSWNENLTYRK